jgi:FlaA1/EpsC-like NDP-sugar epimerase
LPTAHPRILRAQEERFDWATLSALLVRLQAAVEANDHDGMRSLLHTLVPGFQPDKAPPADTAIGVAAAAAASTTSAAA